MCNISTFIQSIDNYHSAIYYVYLTIKYIKNKLYKHYSCVAQINMEITERTIEEGVLKIVRSIKCL
jgi:hypothetical protein